MDYAPHFAAIAEAQQACKASKAEIQRVDREMRQAAKDEATASLAVVGVEISKTLLTLKGRWPYQNKPILILRVTCWSTPVDTPLHARWQLQAHYAFARKDGNPNMARNEDYTNVVCDQPSGFGAGLLERHPVWVVE